ncbi:unnamed protein product, partial [Ixodes pacificus]
VEAVHGNLQTDECFLTFGSNRYSIASSVCNGEARSDAALFSSKQYLYTPSRDTYFGNAACENSVHAKFKFVEIPPKIKIKLHGHTSVNDSCRHLYLDLVKRFCLVGAGTEV